MDFMDADSVLKMCDLCGHPLEPSELRNSHTFGVDMTCPAHGSRARWMPFGNETVEAYVAAQARAERLYSDRYQPELNGPMQGPVREVYDYLDEWAGEAFTDDFAVKMSVAPARQLHAFMDAWPPANGFLDRPASLDVLGRTSIRPAVSGWRGIDDMLSTALSLLFYVDQVVVESDAIDPFMHDRNEPEVDRANVRKGLGWLARLRPLILDGSITFAGRWRGTTPGRSVEYMSALHEVPLDQWRYKPDDELATSRGSLATLISGSYLLVEEQKATALARNFNEELANAVLFSGHRVENNVTSQVDTLSRFNVPTLTGDVSRLVQLRGEVDMFKDWRRHLNSALSLVEGVPDSPDAVREAQGIMADELLNSLAILKADAERSPALRALSAAAKRLTFNAVGAAAGVGVATVTGNPLAGVLTGVGVGVGTNTAATIGDYLRFRRLQRPARAIWDIALSFRDDVSKDR